MKEAIYDVCMEFATKELIEPGETVVVHPVSLGSKTCRLFRGCQFEADSETAPFFEVAKVYVMGESQRIYATPLPFLCRKIEGLPQDINFKTADMSSALSEYGPITMHVKNVSSKPSPFRVRLWGTGVVVIQESTTGIQGDDQ
jgi:hypothetical protein